MPDFLPLLITGMILLGAILFVYFRLRSTPRQSGEVTSLEMERRVLEERIRALDNRLAEVTAISGEKDRQVVELKSELTRRETELKALTEKHASYRSEVEQLQEKFRAEFRNLANEILEEKTLKFTEHNRNRLEEILKPLGLKIQEFEKRVEETYDKESKQRFSLEKEIRTLAELNLRISEDAQNLTTALKSDVKKQGNWGELVLERVLESSGLTRDLEYTREFVTRSGEGEVYRPDVIVHLPEGKHIIIDAKVSLNAYTEYVNAEQPEERERFLKLHLLSIRNHVKLLSEKSYQQLEAFDTPDYVLLFLPIESSFSLAVQNDVDLFHFSWEKNIVIVSPTTLLATLRTVASIWKHEKQELNAQDIAKRSGDLYDKFIGFLEDLTDIGTRLDQTRKSYDQALNKLHTGKGNLISRAEKIRELGARTSKNLPAGIKEQITDDPDDE